MSHAPKSSPRSKERMGTYVRAVTSVSKKAAPPTRNFKFSRNVTGIPNDYIEFLFPYIDHNFGCKKASNLLLVLLMFSPYSHARRSYMPADLSLSSLAALTAQTVKTVQECISVVESLGLVSTRRDAGKCRRFVLNRGALIKLTVAAIRLHGHRFRR